MRFSYLNKIFVTTLLISFFSGSQHAESASMKKSVTTNDSKQSSIIDSYIKIQEALASDSMVDAHSAANKLEAAAIAKKDVDIAARAKDLKMSKNIEETREKFKGLFELMQKYIKGEKDIHPVFCPMAKAKWYQHGKKINNPYYGKSMPECGVLRN